MGNYFNELRWTIIRANNLFQYIHQVTIEFRFQKSLAQERFKSNLEFRYQIIAQISHWFSLCNDFYDLLVSQKSISWKRIKYLNI